MVMFHHIPYSIAQKRGVIQADILNQLSEGIEDVKDLDIGLAKQLVESKLEIEKRG
jgi:kynurenine 3-monooxygenase